MTFLCTHFVILVTTPDPWQFLSERDLQYLYKVCSTAWPRFYCYYHLCKQPSSLLSSCFDNVSWKTSMDVEQESQIPCVIAIMRGGEASIGSIFITDPRWSSCDVLCCCVPVRSHLLGCPSGSLNLSLQPPEKHCDLVRPVWLSGGIEERGGRTPQKLPYIVLQPHLLCSSETAA